MKSDLAVTKQAQSGEPIDQRYKGSEAENLNSNEIQNKTSYFGFRVSSEFKSDIRSHLDPGSGKKMNKIQNDGYDSP